MAFKFNFNNVNCESKKYIAENNFLEIEVLDLISPDSISDHLISTTGLKYIKLHNSTDFEKICPTIQVSDLITNEYEGGYKIWECTYDLCSFLNKLCCNEKTVLDLGCGAGFLGIISILNGSQDVWFQDYNKHVLQNFTMPNIFLNIKSEYQKYCHFVSGDWSSIYKKQIFEKKFDLIVTSETIYNPQNLKKMYQLLKQSLKIDGSIYIAAKSHYFGVGGSVKLFLEIVQQDNYFKYNICWKTDIGIPRVIIHLTI